MDHGPNIKTGKDNAFKYKTRLGIIMFFIYSAIYAGFVAINVINPDIMGMKVLFNLNLAIVYGIGLIIFAIVLGLIYNHMCTSAENRLNANGGSK